MHIINHAVSQGKTPSDPAWPIAALMEWGRDSVASSVAERGDLSVRGMVDLRLELVGIDGKRCSRSFGYVCYEVARTGRAC